MHYHTLNRNCNFILLYEGILAKFFKKKTMLISLTQKISLVETYSLEINAPVETVIYSRSFAYYGKITEIKWMISDEK